jgi:Transposase, Mutator family
VIGICRRRTKDAGPEASARSLSACGRSTKRSAGRDLSEFAEAYLFVDGVAERLHAGLPREAVLCAWGLTDDGRKVLLHLAPGTKEDTASCTAFFEDLKRRGLADPLLVVTDGAPGCGDVLSAGSAPALPGAPPPQPAQQGARQPGRRSRFGRARRANVADDDGGAWRDVRAIDQNARDTGGCRGEVGGAARVASYVPTVSSRNGDAQAVVAAERSGTRYVLTVSRSRHRARRHHRSDRRTRSGDISYGRCPEGSAKKRRSNAGLTLSALSGEPSNSAPLSRSIPRPDDQEPDVA